MSYLKHYNRRQTPQSEPIPGSAQVPNSAGGYGWPVDDWQRLDRFLILGSEGGSYYVNEQRLTRENAEAVARCIAQDGLRTVRRIIEISDSGRAPKNDPAIFALAMCAGLGDVETRKFAVSALHEVCRTGTHLFRFAEFVGQFRGWGRALRAGVGAWYTDKIFEQLVYQMVKYRQRDGWTHADLLRLAHPTPPDAHYDALFEWAVDGVWPDPGVAMPDLIAAYTSAQQATDAAQIVGLIRDYKLPREAIPSEFLGSKAVWEALSMDMPMTALIRNLPTLTRHGIIAPFSDGLERAVAQIGDAGRIRKARVHPLQILAALLTYRSGRSVRGSATWTPVAQIVDALDAAFYTAFGNVEPSNKRQLLALDVSSSMMAGEIAGVPGLSPRLAAAAMALITANVEPEHAFMAFSHQFVPLAISPRMRLDDVLRVMNAQPFGGTDCALPMNWAREQRVGVDAFVIYTDSETWAGRANHPSQALAAYRAAMQRSEARLVVVGLVSNGFSIADPDDGGMLDVVGFDTATPSVISQFIAG